MGGASAFRGAPPGAVPRALLFADHEEHAARVQPPERGGVVVGAVEDGDVADAQIPAEPLHFAAVGDLDAGHAGEGGKARGHVAAQVELGRGLLAAVARPVDGFERQGQDRGVHRVDAALAEAREPSLRLGVQESTRQPLQTLPHAPEKRLRDSRVARAVGVGERVAASGTHPPDATELLAVDFFGVADLVEAERAAELGEHEGKNLFLIAEPAGLDAASFGKRIHHARRNELDNLGQGG